VRLIVGLGNPGREYEDTRHNLGFHVVSHLAKEHDLQFSRSRFKEAMAASGTIAGQDVLLLLPLTYMNQSGLAVRAVVSQKRIPLENILIVCDDLALDFGQMRLRRQGSDGGHKGLRSLIEEMKARDFARLRLGIGSPRKKDTTTDYVLGEFSDHEKKELPGFTRQARDCCLAWLALGIQRAMNRFNKRKANDDEQI